MRSEVRVRYAPSPTGGLHIGGVRTVLYNFLFARQHAGRFILRIEDTDQSRFVPGAEEFIKDSLRWCGLEPDEGPTQGGPFGPYRQSDRKAIYGPYAEQLVRADRAYYAFDRPLELETMRARYKSEEDPNPQYDRKIRMKMRNSLSLTLEETERLLEDGTPHVIRLKMPEENIAVSLDDLIRGRIEFQTENLDDKVLLKADGMPTYHLAAVIDDYLMDITHVFRGEEWLPSAPAHVLIWRYLFGEEFMPQWVHMPLILKPDGNGKLSKRDGGRLGFPVFAMDWTDPNGETHQGFKEIGFLQEAFLNMLAMLGWNDGTGQEIFSLDELIAKFSLERVHTSGAKFDYEKAKWFNHEWIKRSSVERLYGPVRDLFGQKGLVQDDPEKLRAVIALVKDRCSLLPEIVEQGRFFFEAPTSWDLDSIRPKWNEMKFRFFQEWVDRIEDGPHWSATWLEERFKMQALEQGLKAGDLQLPLRVMLVGEKKGPPGV